MTAKRTEMCINHPDRAAATRCAACHKPICEECIVSTAEGKFCSQQCAQRTADFRKHSTAGKKAGSSVMSFVKLIVAVVIVAVVAYVGYRVFVKKEKPGDLLERTRDTLTETKDKAADAIEDVREKASE